MTDIDLERAHSIGATRNRAAVERSEKCGCFHCLAIFPARQVTDWVPREGTAMCPRCGIDSVLGDAGEFPVTPGFLRRMHQKWFVDPP